MRLASKQFVLEASTPAEFLSYLQHLQRKAKIYSIDEPLVNWVHEEDIPKLIELLDSKEPYAAAVLSVSSHLPARSTVGAEASFMLEGFRAGKYPPALYASSLKKLTKKEATDWWVRYKSMD